MDIYLWLSYRFIDMYPHSDRIRSAQGQLDDLIQQGVAQITKLIQDTSAKSGVANESKSSSSWSQINTTIKWFLEFVIIFFILGIVTDKDEDICHEYKRDKERFADYLIRKGVLSRKMLENLKNELLDTESNSLEYSSDQKSASSKTNRAPSSKRTKKKK